MSTPPAFFSPFPGNRWVFDLGSLSPSNGSWKSSENADWDQLSLCSWSPLPPQQRVTSAHLPYIYLWGPERPCHLALRASNYKILRKSLGVSAFLTGASGLVFLPQGPTVGISYGILSGSVFPADFGGRPGIYLRPFNPQESFHIWLHETEKTNLQHGLRNYGPGKKSPPVGPLLCPGIS